MTDSVAQNQLRVRLVSIALEWERAFGVAPQITSAISEYDTARLLGHTDESFSNDCVGRTTSLKTDGAPPPEDLCEHRRLTGGERLRIAGEIDFTTLLGHSGPPREAGGMFRVPSAKLVRREGIEPSTY